MNDNGRLFLGLLAGLGLGTILGILIAPDKGSKTYKKLEKAVKDAANDIVELSESALKDAEEQANKSAAKSKK